MAKHDKPAPNPESPLGAAMRATFRTRRPEPPDFNTPAEERAWFREQERIERAREEAARKYPPGSKLFVTTARGIVRRGRSGVSFTDKGRTTVEVVDLDDDTIARIRRLTQPEIEALHKGEAVDGLEGVDAALATRIRGGDEPLVSPMGAKAIAEDDGLVVLESGKTPSSDELDAKDREIAELKAQNLRLQNELAAARRGSSAGEGGPERLASKPKASTPATSEPFGGDSTDGKGKS